MEIKPPTFRPRKPMNAKGLDCSHHNGQIDWDRVAGDGESFVFCKATEGVGFDDPTFVHNVTAAAAKGLRVGAYHFLRPDQDAHEQAKHFLAICANVREHLTLGIVVDVEPSLSNGVDRWESTPRAVKEAKLGNFLRAVDDAGYGRCRIYCSPGWWSGMFGMLDFSGHELWAASYSHEPDLGGTCWAAKGWTIWQTSEKGTVPGAGTRSIDTDVWKGALPEAP